MLLTEDIIKALNLTEDEVLLCRTPFRDLTKEGTHAAFAVADKVHAHIDRLKEEERKVLRELSEADAIERRREEMLRFNNPQPRRFY
jgi:hypothetical protein